MKSITLTMVKCRITQASVWDLYTYMLSCKFRIVKGLAVSIIQCNFPQLLFILNIPQHSSNSHIPNILQILQLTGSNQLMCYARSPSLELRNKTTTKQFKEGHWEHAGFQRDVAAH